MVTPARSGAWAGRVGRSGAGPLGGDRPTRLSALLGRHGPSLGALLGATTVAALWNLRELLDRWSSAVPTSIDNRFQAWTIHWVQGALLGEHGLYSAATFAPAPDSLTYSDHMIGIAVVLLPLRGLGLSPAAVFNTGLVIGLLADAAAGYLLGQVVTGRRTAAVAAGAVYAIGPLPWISTTHIHLVWRAGLPLAVAIIWVLADRRRERAKPATAHADRALLGLLAIVVTWQATVSFITALFVLLVAAVALLGRARDLGRHGVLRAAAAVVLGSTVAAATYLPYLRTRDRLPGFEWQLDDVTNLRANPGIVEPGSSLWGDALGRPLFGMDGFHAFPGTVVLALAAAGVVATVVAWRRSPRAARVPHDLARAGALGIGLVVVGATMAAGPGPGAAREWTPFAVAFRFVPGFSAARASGRFALVALAGASVLSAVAVAAAAPVWARRGSPRLSHRAAGVIAVSAIVAALGVEGLSNGREVTPAGPREIDRVLASVDDPGGVVYLPVGYDDPGQFATQEGFVIRAAAHDRPIVNGYAGFYPPSAKELARRLQRLPSDEALDCLARYEIRFVVVSRSVAGTPWAALSDPPQAAPLQLVTEARGEALYRVPDRPVDDGVCALPGIPR